MKSLLLLGATGSIGASTLEVVRAHPGEFRIDAVVSGGNAEALAAIVREFSPRLVAIADPEREAELNERLNGTDCTVLSGDDGVLDCVNQSDATLCVSAIVGSAGLAPTLAAIDKGMDIALANKETLVAAGAIVTERVRQKNVRLLPVDSEHSALLQCLAAGRTNEIRRMIVTASGGPFRGMSKDELRKVSPRDALAHPTWNMGPKVTIDSATLANKALEVIEAHWLFGLPFDQIDVVVHPQSLVHGLIEYHDGSLMAQIAKPDMCLPIALALGDPERLPLDLQAPSLEELSAMTFHTPDREAFPMLDLGYEAGRLGGSAPAIYSAANEEAVRLFLDERIAFDDIPKVVTQALREVDHTNDSSLEAILAAERNARAHVQRSIQV